MRSTEERPELHLNTFIGGCVPGTRGGRSPLGWGRVCAGSGTGNVCHGVVHQHDDTWDGGQTVDRLRCAYHVCGSATPTATNDNI
eukprot:5513360-Prymnesium_polylepis.1